MSSTIAARDRAAWRSARTLADLGELTALWLEGSLVSQPGYSGPSDIESPGMVPVLAALNRAGYVTTESQGGQAGPGYDGALWEQRAAVEGFAETALVLRITEAAWRAGLAVSAHDPAELPRWRVRYDQALPVTRRDGTPVTSFGACRPRRDLRDRWTGYGTCHRDAVRAVCGAWQITVIDLQWGHPGLLWDVLAETAAGGLDD